MKRTHYHADIRGSLFRASLTAEENQRKESKIAELEKAKETAEKEADTIIKQQQQELLSLDIEFNAVFG